MEIEAWAIARVLVFAQSILEGDLEVIMKALVEEGRSLAPYDLLVQDARIFSRFFTQLLYSHTKKECNKVAHSLTRYVITSLECVVWMEDVLSQLSSVIQVDIAGFS